MSFQNSVQGTGLYNILEDEYMSHEISKGWIQTSEGHRKVPSSASSPLGGLGQLWVLLASTVALFISVEVPDQSAGR